MNQPRIGWIWWTLGAVALDRITKSAIERITPLDYRRTIIPNFFTIVHAHNPGLAFGMFADSSSPRLISAFSIGALVVCFSLTWLLVTHRAGNGISRSGVALILGGALGNLYDRILYAKVTDFLFFQLGAYRWPAFNVADIAITVGAILVGIDLIFLQKHAASAGEV
jgi:signal peptidase II